MYIENTADKNDVIASLISYVTDHRISDVDNE